MDVCKLCFDFLLTLSHKKKNMKIVDTSYCKSIYHKKLHDGFKS